jgi:hypothetical protein
MLQVSQLQAHNTSLQAEAQLQSERAIRAEKLVERFKVALKAANQVRACAGRALRGSMQTWQNPLMAPLHLLLPQDLCMFMHLGSYFGPGPAKYSVPPKQGSQQQASTPWLAQLPQACYTPWPAERQQLMHQSQQRQDALMAKYALTARGGAHQASGPASGGSSDDGAPHSSDDQ